MGASCHTDGMKLTPRIRSLFRKRGGTMPRPRPLTDDEVRITLSPGFNGPVMETSDNYRGKGLSAFLKPPPGPAT